MATRQNAMTEEVESGWAVHLPHDPLYPGVDAFGAAVAPGQGEAGVDGGVVELSRRADRGYCPERDGAHLRRSAKAAVLPGFGVGLFAPLVKSGRVRR